jgi:hypothetical protein
MKYFFMLYTHALSPPSYYLTYLICAGERERERDLYVKGFFLR